MNYRKIQISQFCGSFIFLDIYMNQIVKSIIGRKQELQKLESQLARKSATLCVIKGRRRIGKSRLAKEFMQKYKHYEISGLAPEESVTAKDQREAFLQQLRTQSDLLPLKTDDWSDLFLALANLTAKGRVVVLLDEISWMGSKDPTFLGKFKIAWDTLFQKNPKLIVILCSSVSLWIDENILGSKEFFGRVHCKITLEALSLQSSFQLLEQIGFQGSRMEKFMLLSLTGGVPWYIELIQPNLSAENNIKNLCFDKDGILVDEFQKIFNDLFGRRSAAYELIVKAIAEKSLSYQEIVKATKYQSGGILTQYLKDLIESGYLVNAPVWSIKTAAVSKVNYYRLSDNYLRFYLKYIQPNLVKIANNQLQNIAVSALPGWHTIIGLQLENLVLNNRELIWHALGLNPMEIVMNNPYIQTASKVQQGCQIDYLIQTKYNALYVCEIKFSRRQIGLTVVEEMRDKLQRFKVAKHFTCIPVLIHLNGVTDELESSDYFARVIDFSSLIDD